VLVAEESKSPPCGSLKRLQGVIKSFVPFSVWVLGPGNLHPQRRWLWLNKCGTKKREEARKEGRKDLLCDITRHCQTTTGCLYNGFG